MEVPTTAQQPIRVKTRRMLPDIVDQYGPQSHEKSHVWSLKVQPNHNNGKTYISVFANSDESKKIVTYFYIEKWTFKVMFVVYYRAKQHDFKSVHFECRMVLFYMLWEKSRLFSIICRKTQYTLD